MNGLISGLALKRYYENPSYCGSCRKVITVGEKQKPSAAKIKKFCNSSCAAKKNNRAHPKRSPESKCAECDGPVSTHLKYCRPLCRIRARSRLKTERPKQKGKYVVEWRKELKFRAIAYKGGGCRYCGYSKCVRSLQFHHRDPSQKDFGISTSIRSWKRVKAELDKCDLVCANCHGEVHDGIIGSGPLRELA